MKHDISDHVFEINNRDVTAKTTAPFKKAGFSEI